MLKPTRKTFRILPAAALAALMTFTLVTPGSAQPPAIICLDFPVTDAVPSEDGKYLFLSSKSRYKLYIVGLADGSIEDIAFDKMPESITITPQGDAIYLALLTREHSDYWGEHEGYIAEIDPNTRSMVREFWINEDPYDLVATSDHYLYVSPGSGQWDDLKGYSLATTAEVGSASIRQKSRIKLHPGENAIYSITTDLFPCDIRKFRISSGSISALYDSPYYAEYPMCDYFEMSRDGNKIFTRCGHVFSSTQDQETDMTHIGALGTGWNALALDDKNNIYTVDDTSVRKWHYDTYEQIWEKPLNGKGTFVFCKDNHLVVVTEAGEFPTESSVQIIDPTIKGDIDGDGDVDLRDALLALQVLVGGSPSASIDVSGDVNADGRIGLPEAIYAVQEAAGFHNEPPALNPIGSKMVDENSLLVFTISATDPEGDTLSYSAHDLPGGATFDPDTATFSWTPTSTQSGTYDVTFTVMDRYESDSETVTITVNDVLAIEQWQFTLDAGQGGGNLTLAEQEDGSITADGTWTYYYYGAATGSFADDIATIAGATLSFTGTGTATHPYVAPSPFTININLTTDHGTASGTYTISFSNPAWPPSFSGNVVATRTSGSGITQ